MLRLASEPGEAQPSPVELPSTITYALQPIVDIHSGAVYGVEALVRGTDTAGFASIDAFFDDAAENGILWETELALYSRAVAAFRRLPAGPDRKLFLNVDNRIFGAETFDPKLIAAAAARLGVAPSGVTIELSEKHATSTSDDAVSIVRNLRNAGLRIALDDFGQGFSELKLLYDATPEYVKIDRFFIADISTSPRKRLFVSTVVNLAHVLGARVVAEGVETEQEFLTCREVGCDLAQGWFIARPFRDPSELPNVYMLPRTTPSAPGGQGPHTFKDGDYLPIPPISVEAPMSSVFECFRSNPELTAFPVVDRQGEPLGLIREQEFRTYVYSQFGSDLLSNRTFPRSLANFVVRVPVVEIGSSVEFALESIASWGLADGVIVTQNRRYRGFVSSHALLSMINERRLLAAQDQNPLSHLPGNASINAHILALCSAERETRIFCYFDFNHFKPFNDTYGFRLGDRAIVLFADILKRQCAMLGGFLGHIGGDDFFAAFSGVAVEQVEDIAGEVMTQFRDEIVSFYAPEDRANGYLVAEDRNGHQQIYPLMTCSTAVLVLPAGQRIETLDEFSRATADGKRAAKLAREGRITMRIGASQPSP